MNNDDRSSQDFQEHQNDPQHWQYWYTQWKENQMLANAKDMSVEEAEEYDQFLRSKAEEVAKAHFVEEKFQHNHFEWIYRHNRNGEQRYELRVEDNELAAIGPGDDTVYEILVKEHGTELYIVHEKDCPLEEALDIREKGALKYFAKHKDGQNIASYDTFPSTNKLMEDAIDDQDSQLFFDFGEEMDI